MRVGQAARELRISADWLRRLERKGRIPAAPRDPNGHRRYAPEDIEAVRRTLYASPSSRGADRDGKAGPR